MTPRPLPWCARVPARRRTGRRRAAALLAVVQVACPRFAREDRELFGTHLRAGDVVLVSLSGTVRDPARAGADPDRLPFRRLAFVYGVDALPVTS
ncbi:hypothetical protein [Geodermatophilus normandii]|uniref:hypothetical protein n=1 Tax=Geodermatophilus normandii TaxID=1137989 RepID=UPI000D719591|nr:hypothetical protein [Geodermatophilus normandii]